MEARAAFVKVGLLIAAAIVVGLALLWFLSGGKVRSGTLFETYFSESVQGLQVGSNVQYRGVTVGRVTEIGVVSAEYGNQEKDVKEPLYRQVIVRYLVDVKKIGPFPSVIDAVKIGLRAQLGSTILTGLAYIDLNFVDPEVYPAASVPWKPEAQYIPSIPSAFAQVRDAGQQMLAKLDKVDIGRLAESLTDLASNLNAELKTGDVHTTLAAATELLQNANGAIKAADLAGLSSDLMKTSTALRGLADNPDLSKLMSNGAMATDRLAELTGRMTKLVDGVEAIVRSAQSGTTTLQEGLSPILRNLNATSQSLRDLAESLRQYPAQLLGAPPPRGSLR